MTLAGREGAILGGRRSGWTSVAPGNKHTREGLVYALLFRAQIKCASVTKVFRLRRASGRSTRHGGQVLLECFIHLLSGWRANE